MDTIQRIAKNTGVLFASQVASIAISFFYMLYTARYLGPSDFGVLAFALAFTSIFGAICDFGLQPLTIRELARDRSLASKYLLNISAMKIILGTFSLVLIFLAVNLLGYPKKTLTVVYLLALSIVLKAFNSMFYSIFQAFERMEYQSLGQILNSSLILCGVLLAIKFNMEVAGVAAVYFITSMIVLVYSFTVLKIKFSYLSLTWTSIKIEVDYSFCKYTIKEAFPFGVSIIFLMIFYWIDSVMLSLMKGDTVVGWYNASYRIVLTLQFIPNSFIAAIYPVMSIYYKTSQNSLESLFIKSFKYLTLLGVPMGFGITILAKRLVLLIYGMEYANSVSSLQILIWSLVFIFMSQPFGNLFNCLNRQSVISKTTGICCGLNVFLNLILIPKYSLIGASIATLLTEIASLILLIFWSIDITHSISNIKKIMGVTIKVLFSSAMMSIFIIYFYDLPLFILISLAALLYFITLFFLNGIDKEDVSLIMKLTTLR